MIIILAEHTILYFRLKRYEYSLEWYLWNPLYNRRSFVFKHSVSFVYILKWLFTVVVPGPEPLGFWSGIYSLSIMTGLFFSSAKYHGVEKERINSSIFRFINMHSCWYITKIGLWVYLLNILHPLQTHAFY